MKEEVDRLLNVASIAISYTDRDINKHLLDLQAVLVCEGPKLKSNDPRNLTFRENCVLILLFYLTE